jgi:hypothetical protein
MPALDTTLESKALTWQVHQALITPKPSSASVCSVAGAMCSFLVHQACEATNMGDCPSQQWLWTVVFGVLQVCFQVQISLRVCDRLAVLQVLRQT